MVNSSYCSCPFGHVLHPFTSLFILFSFLGILPVLRLRHILYITYRDMSRGVLKKFWIFFDFSSDRGWQHTFLKSQVLFEKFFDFFDNGHSVTHCMTGHDRLFALQVIHSKCDDTCVISFVFTRIREKEKKGQKKHIWRTPEKTCHICHLSVHVYQITRICRFNLSPTCHSDK